MKARHLSIALLMAFAVSLVGRCSAASSAAVDFRLGARPEMASADAAGKPGVISSAYVRGNSVPSIASGDFNGDGISDFVVAQTYAGHSLEVTVFLGRNDGSLSKGTVYLSGDAASSVAVGDFNHDGKPDIVFSNAEKSTVEILAGNGDGTFRAPVSVALPGVPRGMVAGDFNGDGWADVAIAGNGVVYVLLNNQRGSLAPAATYALSGSGYELVAADVNNDGKVDLCVAMSDTSRVAVLLGKGDGTFARAADFETAISSPYGIAIADLNHDGRADLVVASPSTGKIAVASGNGDGTFNVPAIYAATSAPFAGAPSPTRIAVSDVNGDGGPDIIFTNFGRGTIGVLLNDSHGSFTGPAEFAVGAGVSAMAVADLDKDGWPDIVIVNSSARPVSILYNASSGRGYADARFSSGGLAFGNQKVGVTSARQTITLSNAGGSTLNISSIGVSGANGGDFGQHNNCGVKLLPNTNCNINVNFTPAALGARSAAVVVTDDAVGSPHSVGLTGTGGTGSARVTPSSVAFGGAVINTMSAPKTFTLLNNGTLPIIVSRVTTTGPFAVQTSGCTGELDPGLSCTVAVVFAPTQLGTFTGTLVFTDDASNSPQTANMSGTGEPNTTTTKLTANPNPVVVGHALTLTAHVNPTFKGTPTGTVAFYDGTTLLGTAPLSGGMAQFITTTLNAGSHTLTAVYQGDSVFQGSTSAGVTEQVNQAIATVSEATSLSPAYIFQNVVLTASVNADGGVVATGTISFQQGGATLATAPLVNGAATFTTSFTAAGTFRITATYSGDQNYKTNSSYVDQVIWWAP